MRCLAVENKSGADICQGTGCEKPVHIPGMPAEHSIKPFKTSLPCHECLAGAFFLPGTAKINDSARCPAPVQIFPDSHSRCKRAGSQQIMPASVAAVRIFSFFLHICSWLLTQPRKCIKLSQNGNYRSSAAKSALKSSWDSRKPSFHLKSFSLQCLLKQLCRPVFLKSQFRVFPYFLADPGVNFFSLFNISA